jgi:hypothetical protein
MIDQDVFNQAVEAARARFPEGVWERLPAGQKVEAIHEELRRIDPESVKGAIPINSGPRGRA